MASSASQGKIKQEMIPRIKKRYILEARALYALGKIKQEVSITRLAIMICFADGEWRSIEDLGLDLSEALGTLTAMLRRMPDSYLVKTSSGAVDYYKIQDAGMLFVLPYIRQYQQRYEL